MSVMNVVKISDNIENKRTKPILATAGGAAEGIGDMGPNRIQ